ncbi:hypothetical protein HS041_15645 [Planomonospora sp. ID67723]|uniref:hypothetical protein n=1 Tax=Planomonospora sp. ID67723 TaxID=2738134 RepID=UPI0018C3CC79|nr:hypothetical protein [Planomonospora sp. ID67723]MBG0829203.1 hypothetical protein [Planomonospora sp. ID67723]
MHQPEDESYPTVQAPRPEPPDAAPPILGAAPAPGPAPSARRRLLVTAAATAFLTGIGVTAVVLLNGGPAGPDLTGVEPVYREIPDPYPPANTLTEVPEDCGLRPGTLADLVPKAAKNRNPGPESVDGLVMTCGFSSDVSLSEIVYQNLATGSLTVTFQSHVNAFEKPSVSQAISIMSVSREDGNAAWQEVTGLGDEAVAQYDDLARGGEVLFRHGAVLITVRYSGRTAPDITEENAGQFSLYRGKEIGEKPAVDGALRAAREVAASVGAEVGDVAMGVPPERGSPLAPRPACSLVTPAVLERLALRSAPEPVDTSLVSTEAKGGTCLWNGDPRLEIDTGVLTGTVREGASLAAHHAYLDRYHGTRDGDQVDVVDKPTGRFRTLTGLGDEAFVFSYKAYSAPDPVGTRQCAEIFFRLRNTLTEISLCGNGLSEQDARTAVSLVASDAAAALAR